ncbi:MAG: hypothetical protein ACLPYB_05925 [Desulfobaccales bacterium]
MNFSYCPVCGRETAHKRALGIGTLLGCFFSGGLWLLAIPLYPVRCLHCGTEEGEPTPAEPGSGACFRERSLFKRRGKNKPGPR